MFKYTLLALLLVATIQSSYYISPLYPPTAFEGQFYEVRFRVRGLDFPTFSFKGLPDCFEGSSDGVVSGIPKGPGSYEVTIYFQSDKQKGSKDIVLRITPGLNSESTFQSATVIKASDLFIGYPRTLVYTLGSSIELALEAHNGSAPLVWKYTNLPSGLYGDQGGKIRGSIGKEGYYSFNVFCSDSLGVSAEAYLTLNIQPKTTVRTTQVVQVQNQHVPLKYDLKEIQNEQIQANNGLFAALQVVSKKKEVVASKKDIVAVATLAVNKANTSLEAANKAFDIARADNENAKDRLRLATNALNAAQQNFNLALTQQGNAQTWLTKARRTVSQAQKRVAQAQSELTAAQERLVEAKDKMRVCQENLRTAQTKKDAAKNEYDRAFSDLEDAKSDLEKAKRRKQLADLAVSDAKDALAIVQQARDDSISALNQAEHSLKAAEANLAKLLDKLAYIRGLYSQAQTALGEAQWGYESALNRLYVAQARKESADRATAIALAEGSLSDHNIQAGSSTIGSQGVSFIGCEAAHYPPISGTVTITDILPSGYKVSTGHQILYGGCTEKVNCKVGDSIAYDGFIVNGVINAKRIERVLLS